MSYWEATKCFLCNPNATVTHESVFRIICLFSESFANPRVGKITAVCPGGTMIRLCPCLWCEMTSLHFFWGGCYFRSVVVRNRFLKCDTLLFFRLVVVFIRFMMVGHFAVWFGSGFMDLQCVMIYAAFAKIYFLDKYSNRVDETDFVWSICGAPTNYKKNEQVTCVCMCQGVGCLCSSGNFRFEYDLCFNVQCLHVCKGKFMETDPNVCDFVEVWVYLGIIRSDPAFCLRHGVLCIELYMSALRTRVAVEEFLRANDIAAFFFGSFAALRKYHCQCLCWIQ